MLDPTVYSVTVVFVRTRLKAGKHLDVKVLCCGIIRIRVYC